MASINEPVDGQPVDHVYAIDRTNHYVKVARAYHHNWVSIPTIMIEAVVEYALAKLESGDGPEEITPSQG